MKGILRGKGLRARAPLLAKIHDLLVREDDRHVAEAQVNGLRLFLDARDHGVAEPILAGRGYEPEETAFIAGALAPGMSFLDVGANVGYFTCLAARAVGPAGKVWAFEPDPRNFRLLARAVRSNRLGNVTAVRAAASDRTGAVKLYPSLVNHGDHRTYDPGAGRRGFRVRAWSLDEFFGDPPPSIDFIKMDIQGAEPVALRGMPRLLRRCGRLTLMLELWPEGLRRSGEDPAELLALLASHGLKLALIDGRPLSAAEALEIAERGAVNVVATRR